MKKNFAFDDFTKKRRSCDFNELKKFAELAFGEFQGVFFRGMS